MSSAASTSRSLPRSWSTTASQRRSSSAISAPSFERASLSWTRLIPASSPASKEGGTTSLGGCSKRAAGPWVRGVMARALAIVQARMSSTRLPGKSVADVGGEPMLVLLLRRLKRAQEVERIIVATSTERADDRVEEVAAEVVTDVYRGPLDDVLTRFVGAAAGHPGPLVRITADCPLIDPLVVDEV